MPTPLHVHSWYSLLEGASSVESLLARAAACGYRKVALTDTNNLYGSTRFVDAARSMNLRPILGACLRQGATHCVALIAERAGYRGLCRVISRLHRKAPLSPRGRGVGGEGDNDLVELLCSNAAGLHVLADDPATAALLRPAFGPRLWLELVRPARSPRREKELIEFSRRGGLKLVASTAAHSATSANYATSRLVAAVRQGLLLDRLPQMPVRPEHHLADQSEMKRRFRDLPQTLRDNDALAEQLPGDGDVLPGEYVLPPAILESDTDAAAQLRQLCKEGLRRRGLDDSLDARRRLHEELAVIEMVGLSSYFLVVCDIADFAHSEGHPMALRGSAGNSLVCYLLHITDVNPLRFNLPMERFLHPGRVDLPDIDLDFDWKVRDKVIAHVVERWGVEHTARVSAHQFLQPRSAFRESAKLHGLSEEQISRLIENLPQGVEGADWWAEGGEEPEVPRGFGLGAERWPRILADARLLVGRPRHLMLHPGGIVITPGPAEDYAPLQLAPGGEVLTQLDKDGVERVGLVKIDLLGNRALGTLEEGLRLASRLRLSDPDAKPQAAWLDDPATLDLMRRGDTLGVGQLESPAMRHLLVQMQPRHIDDVIQAIALVRPAAAIGGAKESFVRKRRGLDAADTSHPLLQLLAETEGQMIYEDDALVAIQVLTGMPAPLADGFRKRVAKHKNELERRNLAREFVQLCLTRGHDRRQIEDVWLQIQRFNHYSFCKSHSVSYGLIAWRAAWLKVHHRRAFWVAAVNNNQGMYPRYAYAEAMKQAGLVLRHPCVNRSEDAFTPDPDEDNAVRVGLGAVASLDLKFREALLAERDRHGPYLGLADLCRRLRPGPETLSLLIRCGALDFTGLSRPALTLQADLRRAEEGVGLFSVADTIGTWSPDDSSAEQRRQDEWGLLGFVVDVPMMSPYRSRRPRRAVSSADLHRHVGKMVTVMGMAVTSRRLRTEQDRMMQFVTLQDEDGLIDVTLFPGHCPPVPHLLLGPYVVEGVVEDQLGVITLTARRFELVSGGAASRS